jgi:hypothetical protein
MKKYIFTLLSLLLLFVGCVATKQQSFIIGYFNGRTPAMGSFVPADEMKLSLNTDSSFNLHWLDVDYKGKCNVLDENNILLKFDEITDLLIHLRSGVILDKERTIKVVNKNKLKFGNVTLKRTK